MEGGEREREPPSLKIYPYKKKAVADVVEALIGACFLSPDENHQDDGFNIELAQKFMRWIGIGVQWSREDNCEPEPRGFFFLYVRTAWVVLFFCVWGSEGGQRSGDIEEYSSPQRI